MTDNRFSSGTPKGGEEHFGYFATAQPAAGPPFGAGPAPAGPFGSSQGGPANQFGGPPAPPSPFGGQPGPADPFQTPAYATAGAPGRRRIHPVVFVLAGLLVLGAGWYGVQVYEHTRPVILPTSLDGLPVSTNTTVMQSVAQAQDHLQQENPNIELDVRAYGAETGRILIVVALRGTTNITNDLASFGNNIGAAQQVGTSTCATSPAGHVTVCERSSGGLTVIASSVTRAAAADMPSVATLVDQIWQQN
jgi:hypothetical protein